MVNTGPPRRLRSGPMPEAARRRDQVAAHYRELIRTGQLRPGERFPPIRSIAREWSMSTATVRLAVAVLRDEGWIRTVRGPRGTVVESDPTAPAQAPDLRGGPGAASRTDR